MKTPRLCFAFAMSVVWLSAVCSADDADWPAITRENKPWTRWWWPGSAVDAAGLTQQLEQFAAAGLGGVEVTPIYGAKGYESRYLDFLSPAWMAQLEHTGREAQRLGLGVDMATGTGWPFGGPWIKAADGSATLILQDGRLAGKATEMKVKRAAPGDEGLVIDPYSPSAMEHYLAPIGSAFENFPRELIRSQFHDSFEYYGASWTPELPAVFQRLHHYDVQAYASGLIGDKAIDADTLARVRSDYRETLAQLHLEYLRNWVKWSHDRGFLVRNQSHGAPANLLDLYGAVDIAETETFGSTPFPLPGLRRAENEVRQGLDLPEPLVMRMASSATHVMGHPYASSETCTWLREHWKVTLSDTKPEIDRLFVNGINHIFFHGTVYSPADAPWPGWLFYAATQFNPRNTWWDDFGALNGYIARVQSILQRGRPDNDVLIYWPVFDLWDNAGPLMQQLGVHNAKWLIEQSFGRLAQDLMTRGYSFDYVSEAQLQLTRADGQTIATPGGHYRALVVPFARRMPVATLQKLAQLSHDGVPIIFAQLPEDVPGQGDLVARRAEFKTALTSLAASGIIAPDIPAALAARAIPREAIADAGIGFIRRATDTGHDYFFSNLTAAPFDGWITLGVAAQNATMLDPLTGAAGRAALRANNAGGPEVYLQLAPGESLILHTMTGAATGPARKIWPYRRASGSAVILEGKWSITFIQGGPVLPAAIETTVLKSWTELGGGEAQRFGGTARYRVEFKQPENNAEDWRLDLGDVRESARVRVNGHDVATAWSLPFQVRIGEFLQAGTNVLELDVTNLAANRIRDMDRRKVDWKIMREINFVDINYHPFDASGWDLMPSGLLGPVRLIPLHALDPLANTVPAGSGGAGRQD